MVCLMNQIMLLPHRSLKIQYVNVASCFCSWYFTLKKKNREKLKFYPCS